MEDKAKKAIAKSATVAVEARKRKKGASKVATRQRKISGASAGTSVAVSTHIEEEVTENIRGATSAGAKSGGPHSATSVDLGGDDLVGTIARVLVDLGAKPSAAVPMPGVLGDESSSSEGNEAGEEEEGEEEEEDADIGEASPPREAGDLGGSGLRRPAPGVDEVSDDEAEAGSPVVVPPRTNLEGTSHHAEAAGGSGKPLSPLLLGGLTSVLFLFLDLRLFCCVLNTTLFLGGLTEALGNPADPTGVDLARIGLGNPPRPPLDRLSGPLVLAWIRAKVMFFLFLTLYRWELGALLT